MKELQIKKIIPLMFYGFALGLSTMTLFTYYSLPIFKVQSGILAILSVKGIVENLTTRCNI